MASGPASETILFIGAIIAATAVAGAITTVSFNVASGIRDNGEARADALLTDIEIINDPVNVDVTPDPIIILLNTGDRAIFTTDIDVVIDGVLSDDLTFDVQDSADDETLLVGEVVEITVGDINPAAGDHRMRVQAGRASDTLEWQV